MVRGATKKNGGNKVKFILLFLILLFSWFVIKKGIAIFKKPAEPSQAQEVVIIPEISVLQINADITYTIQDGDVLSDIFKGYEVPFSEIVALEQVESDVFSFTNIQIEKDIHFSVHGKESDFILDKVIYQPDSMRIVTATQTQGGWLIEEQKIQYELKEESATGTVDVSFYASGLEAGLDDKVILAFAEVFAWDIDFVRHTRSGDTFKIIYEAKYLNGQKVTSGKVIAAEYVNAGIEYQVFSFKGLAEDKIGYYTVGGESVQKTFLKVPANFRHVSSGFTNARFHPITKTVIPHNGVDYPAASGTPILAIGDGVITARGVVTAYGNRIEIRHSGVHSSQYAHMSGFGEYRVGDKVKQGDIIGYVGSTGWSTGPHLHFSMTQYGNYIDPGLVDAPAGEAVKEEYKEDFLQKANLLKQQLDQL